MKKLNNKGFGLIELLLLLIFILLLIFFGWYIWKQNQSKQSSESQDSAQQAPEQQAETKDKYLEITEWGVKLKLSEGIEDAIYKMNSGFVYMSTKSYEEHEACQKEAGELGENYIYYQALSRLGENDDLDEFYQEEGMKTVKQAAEKYPDSYIKVGNYYYTFSRGNGIECNPDNSKIKAFSEAFKTIQAI